MIRKSLAIVVGALILALLGLSFASEMSRRRPAAADPASFAAHVDLAPLARLAVHHEGRLRSFDSHASSMMHFVTGPRKLRGQSPAFTYLDLMIRPAAYEDEAVIYVKNKLVRARIRQVLNTGFDATLASARAGEIAGVAAISDESAALATAKFRERMDSFISTGLVSQVMLDDPTVHSLLDELERDVIRTKKDVDAISSAMAVRRPAFLRNVFRIVPPPGGGQFDPWLSIEDVVEASKVKHDLGMPAGLQDKLVSAWTDFESAWQREDPPKASAALASLAAILPAVNPEVYPRQDRLAWESWYFKARNMTWVWLIYGLAFVPLMLSVVYRWPAARWIGLGLFLVAFGFHTFALGLRWYVADRWPNSNMFEAITTSAWFGGMAALALEALARRTALRNFFALCSAAASAAAFMAVHFLPMELNANISNMMPVLHDVWLYIHTNVIIFSYVLIAMAAVPALGHLLYRLAGGAADYARVGGAGSLMVAAPGPGPGPGPAIAAAAAPSLPEPMTPRRSRGAVADGAGDLDPRLHTSREPSLSTSIPRQSRGLTAGSSVAAVLDGTTMVLMELAFVLLWTGLVMGAIWADHSWGRPWGWDPKEVFALNTFIIFALLVHVRLKVKDKGLWTALLAVAGCAVMLFNWIIINFTISGLHSYA